MMLKSNRFNFVTKTIEFLLCACPFLNFSKEPQNIFASGPHKTLTRHWCMYIVQITMPVHQWNHIKHFILFISQKKIIQFSWQPGFIAVIIYTIKCMLCVAINVKQFFAWLLIKYDYSSFFGHTSYFLNSWLCVKKMELIKMLLFYKSLKRWIYMKNPNLYFKCWI